MGFFEERLIAAAEVTIAGGAASTPGTGATSLGKAEDAPHASGDTGVAFLGVRNDNGQSAFASANGDYTPVAVDANGVVLTKTRPATTVAGTQIVVLTAATNAQLFAANLARRGMILVNRSGQEVFLRFGATAASATNFHWVLADKEKYELPFGITLAVQAFSTLAGVAPGLIGVEFID